MAPESKRQRTNKSDLLVLLQEARVIWGRDRDVQRSLYTEDREFREGFGVGAITAMTAWNLLELNNHTPTSGLVMHILWVMMFIKVYSKEVTLLKMAGLKCGKKCRKWIWPFISGLGELESQVVSNL